jgi:hypothetical protein
LFVVKLGLSCHARLKVNNKSERIAVDLCGGTDNEEIPLAAQVRLLVVSFMLSRKM